MILVFILCFVFAGCSTSSAETNQDIDFRNINGDISNSLGWTVSQSIPLWRDAVPTHLGATALADSTVFLVAHESGLGQNQNHVLAFCLEQLAFSAPIYSIEQDTDIGQGQIMQTSINGLATTADGDLWLHIFHRIIDTSVEEDDFENMLIAQWITIKRLDPYGEVQQVIEIDSAMMEELPNGAMALQHFDVFEDGIFWQVQFTTNMFERHFATILLSHDGEMIHLEEPPIDIWFQHVITTDANEIINFSSSGIWKFDMNTTQWEEINVDSDDLQLLGFTPRLAIGDLVYDFYLMNELGFFGLDFSDVGTLPLSPLFDWSGLFGVEEQDVATFFRLSENRFLLLQWNGNLLIVEQAGSERTVLYFATSQQGHFGRIVDEFNRRQTNYLVRMIAYSDGMGNDMHNQLYIDLMTGAGPDIIDLELLRSIPERYIRAGIFEDLSSFLDTDPDLSRESIVPQILSDLTHNGGLYIVSPAFSIHGLYAGQPNMVTEISNMSFLELLEFIAEDGKQYLFPHDTRYWFMRMMISEFFSQFVDLETGEARFESPEFIQALHTAMLFPVEINEQELFDDWRINPTFSRVSLTDVYSPQLHEWYFGTEFLYWGFGGGGNLRFADPVAISATSNQKDGAWQFLREFLLPEFGDTVNSFPINRESFMRQVEIAQTPNIEVDEAGNEVIVYNHLANPLDNHPQMIEIFAMTDAQAERLLQVIDDAMHLSSRFLMVDDVVYDIVMEEIQAFFHGDRTAENTARIIQSRVQIYISEIMG